MKNTSLKIFVLFILIFISSENAKSQISMTATGSNTQDFNTLSNSNGSSFSWTNNSTISSWYASQANYTVGTGSSATGAMYSFGSLSATDRALGSLCSNGTSDIAYGVQLQNNSSQTITTMTVAYTGEQWRQDPNTTTDQIVFYYRVAASPYTTVDNVTTGWTAVTGLNFTNLKTGTAGAIDGNAAGNRAVISAVTIPSLSIPAGSYVFFKWIDLNVTGNDQGMSIDDVTITWTVPTGTPTVTITAQDPNTPTAVDWGTGTTGNIFYWASISPTVAAATLNTVKTDMTGTYQAADIASNGFKLYYSADFTFTPGSAPDVLLGSQNSAKSGATETITWSSLSQTIAQNGTGYIYAVADIASGATTGRTIAGTFTNDANVIFNPAANYSAGNTYGAVTNKTIIQNPTNPTTFAISCASEVKINVNLNTPTSGTVLVFANSTGTFTAPTGAGSSFIGANTNYASAPNYAGVGGKLVYSGPGANFSMTGLTAGTPYYLKAYSYNNSVWSSGTAAINGVATTQPVTFATATAGDKQITLNWSNPGATSCFNNVIIIARAGSPVEASISKATFDGLVSDADFTGATSIWTANSNTNDVYDLTYTLVGTDNTNFLVYKGTGSSVTLTALTNNVTYYYSIFTVDGTGSAARWSNVVTLNATPLLANTATDYFQSNVNGGAWNTASSWQYSADNGNTIPWATATLVPNQNASGILIRNGFNINSSTNITADDIKIEAGATLSITGGTFTLNNGTAATDLQVEGTLLVSGGTFTNSGAGINFAANSEYRHNINGGTIPTATWDPASLCNIRGITNNAPSGIGQTFGNFTWNCTGQTTSFPINNSSFNTTGLLTVSSTGAGTSVLNLNSTTGVITNSFKAIKIDGGTFQLSYLSSVGGQAGYTVCKVAGNVDITSPGRFDLGLDVGGTTTTFTGGIYVAVLEIGGDLTVSGASPYFRNNGSNYSLVIFNKIGSSQTLSNSLTASTTINYGLDYAVSSVSSLTLATGLSLDGTYAGTLTVAGTIDCGTQTVTDAQTNGAGTYARFELAGNQTFSQNGSTTNGSYIVNGIASTANIFSGMAVSGPGIPANTYVADYLTDTKIILTNPATSTGTVSLTFTSAGKLITSNAAGITSSGTTGSIRVRDSRYYSSSADYEFKGAATGNFANITTPAANTVRNLTINNASGVTQTSSTNIAVNGALNLTSGTFNVNGNTLTINGTIPSPVGNINNNSLAASTVVFNISGYTINPGLFTPSGEVQNITNNPGIGNTNTLNGNFIFNNTLNLQSGVLDNGNNSLTFRTGNTPLSRTAGTLSMGASSSLTFGTTGNTGGSAFQIPDGTFTSGPIITNMTVNRTNQLTLGNQGMQLTGALTLTLGTLNIGPNTLLDLNGASLTATGGYLSGNAIAPSSSDFTVRGTTGGTVTIPQNGNIGLRTLTVGGTRYVSMNGSNNITLSNTLTIASGATFDNGGDLSQLTSSGTPTVVVDGRFITRHPGGFNGGSSAITSATVTLNNGSTVEYGRAGDQSVQGSTSPGYKNVTFSGSGTKTLLSATTGKHPLGTVYITGSAIFDQGVWEFGEPNSNNTNLTMDGGRYRLSGTGSKPDIDGTYLLTGGVIEFYNSAVGTAETVKPTNKASASIQYNAIEITGSNVGQGNGNINLRSNGTFTVKGTGVFTNNADAIVGPSGTQTVTIETNGRFITGNALGFYGATSGLNSPSVRDNIETVVLQTNSTIEYSRASAQNFTPISTSPVTNYQNVVISGGGAKNLTGAVSMDGILTLTSGLVNTSNLNILTLTTNATCPAGGYVNGAAMSFINGPMKKSGTANFTFPVGKTPVSNTSGLKMNGGYRPIGISSITGFETFQAEYILGDPYLQGSISTTALGAGLQRISRCEYWNLTRSGSQNAAVTLSWSSNPDGQSQCNTGEYVNDLASLVVVPYYNGQWGDQNALYFGRSGTTGSTTPIAADNWLSTITWGDGTAATIDSYLKFVLGTISAQNSPLPFEIKTFRATGKDKKVYLDWTINNNDQFENYIIERSKDGINFEPIINTPATALLTTASYREWDNRPFDGWNYYRLRGTDLQQQVFYSAIQRVWMGTNATVEIGPVPAHNTLNVYTTDPGSLVELVMLNSVGQILHQTRTIHAVTEINLSGLPSGIYYIRIVGKTETIVKPFTKQ